MSNLGCHPSRLFIIRSCLAAAFLVFSANLGFISFFSGASRILSQYGLSKGSLHTVDDAVRQSASDPEAHYARSVVLLDTDQYADAVKELETAVTLRPEDYYLWMELGRASEDAGDLTRAESAFRQSVRLAPYYAQPRWLLGNLMLRNGEQDKGFAELRLATNSDEKLFPALTDLAWSFYDGDVRSTIEATEPQTNAATLELAEFFINHGKRDGVDLLRASAGLPQANIELLVARLLQRKDFVSAFEVWLLVHPPQTPGGTTIADGSFEQADLATGLGFSWRISPEVSTLGRRLEVGTAQSGSRCLKFQFKGISDPNADLVFQYVVVEPGVKYRLRFAARGKELVTASLPLVAILDATNAALLIAQSEAVPRGSSGWQEYSVDFETSATQEAIRIIVRRQQCSSKPCPIFGETWFDSFVLEKREKR